MIYDMLYYYKKNFSTYNLVFKHIKYWHFLFITSPFVFSSIVIVVSFTHRRFYEKILCASILIPFILLFIVINRKAKKVVNELYGVSSELFMWNSPRVLRKIYSFEKEEMLKYLREENEAIEIEELKKMSETAASEAKKFETKFPLIPSFFAALFISLWNNFFGWIYSTENMKSLDLALSILGNMTVLIIMIIGLYIMIRGGFGLILHDILNRENKLMLNLSRLLKDICDDLDKEARRAVSTNN